MSDVIGIAWYKDESAYRKALGVFADPQNMPASYEEWRALVGRQLELTRECGNIAIRVDIDPEAFVAWCASRGLAADSWGRTAFVKHIEIEYMKTGKATFIE